MGLFKMADSMKEESVAALLKGIDRYNPENLQTLEHYVQMQAFEQTYNLGANLAVLKLYQFNPLLFKETVTCQILLKALMNLPHTDFVLCKCLIAEIHQATEGVNKVIELAHQLETCDFKQFWFDLEDNADLIEGIRGFRESIRRFIASVLHVTYQNISTNLLIDLLGGISSEELASYASLHEWVVGEQETFLHNQEALIKSKSISEKLGFEDISKIMIRPATQQA